MTTTEALSIIESHTALFNDPKMAEALRVVRKALPKPRKTKAKMHPAAKIGGPLLFGQRGSSWGGDKASSNRAQRTLYLSTFDDPKAQEARIRALPRSPQFDYDPPARMKDDERRTPIAALVSA